MARLRFYLLHGICLILLSGCVNYAGMKPSAKPFTAADLSTHQTFKTPQNKLSSNGWWHQFHDRELNQLITTALSDSPTMQKAQSRVKRAQQLAEKADASLWPTIDASGYVQRERFSEFGLVPPPFNGKTFNIGEVGLNFNYEFDFWGKNRELLAARVSEQCAAEADLAQASLILSAAVANTYFQLKNNNEQLRIAKQLLHKQQETLEIVQDRAHHGIESDIPVSTAEANVESAKLTVAQFEAAKKLSLNRLAVLIGKNPIETEIEISTLTYRPHHIHLPASLPANLLAERPDIRASRLRVEAAAHQIKVAKARFFPNINLNGLFSYQSVGLGHLFDPDSQNNAITGAIDLPIFDAGARRANLGIRNAEYDIAVSNYNQTILRALREVADQLALLHSVQSQLRSQQAALHASERKFKLTTSRYKHGIVDYTQVLTSKKQLLQQQAIQTELQMRYLQAFATLIKALGGYNQA